MKRRKHKNDTKANTHWERWARVVGDERGIMSYNHYDWNVDGRLRKRKQRGSLASKEIREYKGKNNV